jgi:pilus assembly protein Flp/PilA
MGRMDGKARTVRAHIDGAKPQGGEVMRDFMLELAARRDSEDGQTMVEYGLILAIVSIVAIATLVTVGTDLKAIFTSVATHL